jgi:hypothetical protein
MADKAGYEPIPDVEDGEGGVPEKKENYADLNLNDKQTKLLLDLDSTIASATLDLSIPKNDPSQLASDFGQSFIMVLVAPTLVAVCTFLAALFLEETAKAENAEGKLAGFLVQYFPYVAAIAMFLSSVSPIRGRLMAAIEPMSAKIDFGKDAVEKAVANIGPEVDSTIVALQVQVNEVLEPMEPTLKHSERINKVDPSLEILDIAEIDKEMDEAQGVVGPRIKEAQKHLRFDQYIPGPLKSKHAFYWRVVFPTVLLFLAIQLVFATFSQCSLVMSVVWAYMIAFLQLGVVFLLSNNLVRAWLTNTIVSKIEDETMRTLREYGASSSFSDVLGTRMGRVRKKVLKVLKLYKKIESLMDRIVPGLGDAEATGLEVKETTAGLDDKGGVSDKGEKKGAGDKGKGRVGFLGRVMSGRKKKK